MRTHSWNRPIPLPGSGDSRICVRCQGHLRWMPDEYWWHPKGHYNRDPLVLAKIPECEAEPWFPH